MNLLSRSAALASWVALPTLVTASGPGPDEVLLRSFQRVFPVNVRALIVQRDPAGDGLSQLIRVERDKSGKTRHSVLQPLRLAGTESVDDGNRNYVYWPDRNVLINQVSPQKDAPSASDRIKIARRNYKFSFGKSEKVAGRETYCVVATPNDRRMDVRRYYIDTATYYPLRLETVVSGRVKTVFYDTKDIQFPSKIEPDRFKLKPVGSPRVMEYSRPTKLAESEAKAKLGFKPVVPKKLPMGFQVQEMQLTSGNSWRSLAIRITDGLVRATVYQWRPSGDANDVASIEVGSSVAVGDIRVMLVSDLGEEERSALLRAFGPGGVARNLGLEARTSELRSVSNRLSAIQGKPLASSQKR